MKLKCVLQQTVCHDFDDEDGSIGDFVGDDDFKKEIFLYLESSRVAADVAQDTTSILRKAYHDANLILCILQQQPSLHHFRRERWS
jgi:hypothetical protein